MAVHRIGLITGHDFGDAEMTAKVGSCEAFSDCAEFFGFDGDDGSVLHLKSYDGGGGDPDADEPVYSAAPVRFCPFCGEPVEILAVRALSEYQNA